MNDNPLPQEPEKDPASRKKECLKYMAEFQKAAAAQCAKSDLPVEALDTSIRAFMIL